MMFSSCGNKNVCGDSVTANRVNIVYELNRNMSIGKAIISRYFRAENVCRDSVISDALKCSLNKLLQCYYVVLSGPLHATRFSLC